MLLISWDQTSDVRKGREFIGSQVLLNSLLMKVLMQDAERIRGTVNISPCKT
jgi:hypothetical protein